ncbi:MAG: hypothetical protein QW156_04315 [Candidatus Aenigmatarchaeota archaeon]
MTKKMAFNLIRRFILWLMKIFHIRSPEEVSSQEEKSAEGKPTQTPSSGERPGEILSENESGETEPPEEKPPEVPQEPSQVSGEGEVDKTKPRKKPRTNKPLTEEGKKEQRPSEDENKSDVPKQIKKTDLGDIKKKKIKPDIRPQPPAEGVRLKSPYVEINLDEAKVFLVIPEQKFKAINNIPRQLSYKLLLNNGNEQTISVRVSKNEQGIITVEGKRIYLEEPLKEFEIVYPDELQGRPYSYRHRNEILYPFIATGNNRGRMHYLYNEKGIIDPLPRKDVWFLLKEDFESSIDPDIIDERWIWEKYQPICINLKNTNELVIKNRQTEEELKIPCKLSFSVESDALIEDDFKNQMPLFAGNSIKIKAPTVNQSGWVIWIQNRQAGYKVITENWTGSEPLELKLPDYLPCECGEFQVDICEQKDGFPAETLFFRYIPYLQLIYPRSLIIPEANRGHKQEIIQILWERDFQDWELIIDKVFQYKYLENGYQVELSPEQDVLRFSLVKKDKPETKTGFQITLKRLKWKTSKDETWYDKPLHIQREELVTGTDFYLMICTNDFDTKYDLLAILETNGQKLQEAKFIRKDMTYNLLLNQFYDTIKKNNDKMTLRVEIRIAGDKKLLNQVDVIHLPGITKEKHEDKPLMPSVTVELSKKRKNMKNIRPDVMGGAGRIRKGKGFSKGEIIEAGMDMNDIRRLNIPFDKRRKSIYSKNVEILKSLKGGK